MLISVLINLSSNSPNYYCKKYKKSGKEILYITSMSSESMLMVKLFLDCTADFLTAASSLF